MDSKLHLHLPSHSDNAATLRRSDDAATLRRSDDAVTLHRSDVVLAQRLHHSHLHLHLKDIT